MPAALPVDAVLPELLAALRSGQSAVLEAPPGAGKTTRVPPALLDLFAGEVLVLEPRRLAARMAARRVAWERGERVGETVGYQVRFEDVSGPGTRLRFLTEGVLHRRLLRDPDLRGVSAVVLDEFHERHLDGDLALALLRRLQLTTRADLRTVVMSATLDSGALAAYLDGCPWIRSEGRLFDVDITYRGYSPLPLEDQVAAALNRLDDAGVDGDILVFLPGAAEIRRSARACEDLARRAGMLLVTLHGDLPPEEQDRAVAPAERPKIILSTNVAESSVTIEGVTTVVDSGLARIAGDSLWTGLPTLEVQRISRASAIQRAGRAGRLRPGRALRLYSAEDFARRPFDTPPEIRRRELSQTLLELDALGTNDPPWYEPPPPDAVAVARELLLRLDAPRHGRAMARYPLHPRLGRMLVEADVRGARGAAERVAALLSSGDRPDDPDLLRALDRPLSPGSERIRRQLARSHRSAGSVDDRALLHSVLAGFPDRVARRRTAEELQIAGGLAVRFTAIPEAQFLVVLDLEDRRDGQPPLARLAARIEPDWLIDLFPDRITEVDDVVWNREAERAERYTAMLYDGLPLHEHRGGHPHPEAAGRLLAERASEAGIERFTDAAELSAFLDRVAFAAVHSPHIRELTAADLRDALASVAAGLRSFAELRRAPVLDAIRALVPQHELDLVAPERIRIGPKRLARITYPRAGQPFVASRLQDFFGMRESPRIAGGAVPVVLHLLAPNNRPVQTTTDLAGFWTRLYPQVRRELMRRYPKHAWPEIPC